MPRNRQIVDAFYAAIAALDVEAISAVMDEGFAVDLVTRLPDSLPYGGTHRGRDTFKAMLATLVRTSTPMVMPSSIRVVRVADAGDDLVVETEFEWLAPGAQSPIPMRAVEWLTFREHRVVAFDVCYWDTAACAEACEDVGT